MTSIIEKAVEKALGERVWVVEVLYRAVRITLQNAVKIQMVEGCYLIVEPRDEKYSEEESRIVALINSKDDEVIALENFFGRVIEMNQAYLGLVGKED